MSDSTSDALESDAASRPPHARFRIPHLLYVIAQFGVTIGLFGAAGILVAGFIAGAWAFLYFSRSLLVAFGVLAGVTVLLMCLGLPALQFTKSAAKRTLCANNLKQLAIALQGYEATHGCFPPAYLTDETGRPMHSWRVLILPFVERPDLYEKYNFSEPWDGPNNRKLAVVMPRIYACPVEAQQRGAGNVLTNYVAVVGENTMWPESSSVKVQDIYDAPGNTLHLVETQGHPIHWMEPRDLSHDQAVQLLAAPAEREHEHGHANKSFFYRNVFTGRNAVFADARVDHFPPGMPHAVATALLTQGGGEVLDQDDLVYPANVGPRKLNYGNCLRLALFVLVTFWPVVWMRRRA